MVRHQVRLQFSYIEADLGVPNLVAWWDVFSADYFELVASDVRTWAEQATNTAAQPFIRVHSNGRVLRMYDQALGALYEMTLQIPRMQTPPDDSTQNPGPPGGGVGL
jgi:hypothetical protein